MKNDFFIVKDELSKQWVDEFEKEEIEEDKDDYLNSIPDVTDVIICLCMKI